jgi:hypothetical protein
MYLIESLLHQDLFVSVEILGSPENELIEFLVLENYSSYNCDYILRVVDKIVNTIIISKRM